MAAAAVLMVAALVLLCAALVWSRDHDQGFAVNRDSVRFGGGGRGWEASRSVVALAAAAGFMLLAVMLAFQVIDRSGEETKTPETTKNGKGS